MARITGTKNITPNTDANQTISAPADGGKINLNISTNNGQVYIGNIVNPASTPNVGNPAGALFDPLYIYGTTAQREQASAYFPGGVGIEKDLNVGGLIYGRISIADTSSQLLITATNISSDFYLTFVDNVTSTGGKKLWGDNNGAAGGLIYNPADGKITSDKLKLASSDPLTLEVTGGVEIGSDLTVGGVTSGTIASGSHFPNLDNTYLLGDANGQWAEAWLNKIYSNTTDVKIQPGSGLTEIVGNIRVRDGDRPIGTAPVVTNILYVTMDGDDTNDGRAQDASRACRTIGAALNSPYYQSGTQIRVAPGHYLEDNPLRLKPYTSIVGSDLRTTSIEPINKTQDLFHLDSGCYLAFMQFLNGRSGLLEGTYREGTNRGAYCTAFPPLPESERIDLYHSPYIQNCTNLSGPWLKDGTMFVPNQTVQVPAAVGTGTWVKGVNTLTITISEGTIERGMSINAGQQNPGFFNARTLLLANKPFLQEQTISYISDQIALNIANTSSIWYGFTYSQEYCYRDVAILVENVAYDAAFGGNEKAVESGLAYYRGVVSLIAGQEQQTSAAIEYIRDRAVEVVTNTTCTNTYTGATSQVRNIVLTGGEISTASIVSLFDTIVTIINDGPEAAPDVYKSTGPDAAFVSAEVLMEANRTFIQENVLNKINNDLCVPPKVLKFNKIKCKRDVGLIVDSIALDMLAPTVGHSQSTFAGVQYFNQNSYVGNIANEITTTTAAISYLKDLAVKIIQNIEPQDDLVDRYQTSTPQVVSLEPASEDEVYELSKKFDVILEILRNGNTAWSDRIVSNGAPSDLLGVANAVALLQANRTYMADEVNAYISAENPTFVYNTTTCARDVGYIIDSVMFDLKHGGNRQSVQSGLSYYGISGSRVIRESEKEATTSSFQYVAELSRYIIKGLTTATYQSAVDQTYSVDVGTDTEADLIDVAVSTLTNIIWNGTATVTWGLSPISTATILPGNALNSFNLLMSNKEFIKEEVVARLDSVYNANSFNYNEEKCYRDTGLIIDAVSQDILLGGNSKSIEAGLAYWNNGYNHVEGQITTTTMAIGYARDIALQVIANNTVTVQSGTVSTQIINPFFQYGGDYMPQEAVTRNFNIITDIIQNGPSAAPPVYQGGGLFALTGINGADVKLPPKVTSITTLTTSTYLLGLNTSTVGFGNNATLYFGNVASIPYQDNTVEELSLEYTGSTGTWAQRKIDPIGAMGGSLVDGAVVSSRSPIQSFVYDAFTQLPQGGRGIRITNNGYAQLVSVFTIFCSTAVQVDNGGIASITNSNSNFGDLCLVSKGYGRRDFSGTVFNPLYRSYPFDPGPDGLDQYYPTGFWPNNGRVEIFTPDLNNRPHIGQVMEVIPPDGHLNEQGFPGFLITQPSTSTITTGTLVLTGVDTTDVAIGHTIRIRNQFGSEFDSFPYLHDVDGNPIDSLGNPTTIGLAPANPNYGVWYAATGTIVTDVNYNSITLNQALTNGGGDPNNDAYFTVYFCGNAYYTVLSSSVADTPYVPNQNILSANTNTNYQGTTSTQITQHDLALGHLNTLVTDIIANTAITPSVGNTSTSQTILPLVTGGSNAQSFIDLRFNIIRSILTATNITAAEAVVPARGITKTGTIVPGSGSAVELIEANIDFLAEEVSQFVQTDPTVSAVLTNVSPTQIDYILAKCKRDTKIILQRIIYDLQTGGTYNAVMAGLSYWSRAGTHHIVELGEAVNRTDLFPDGSTVNFYQRSYISASGYLFEYVGAGTNYGSLPQVGRADPVQTKEVVMLNGGKVFYTSTDQNGDFRIGPGLTIAQATGVISGRVFVQSLYGNLTPFILAIEGS